MNDKIKFFIWGILLTLMVGFLCAFILNTRYYSYAQFKHGECATFNKIHINEGVCVGTDNKLGLTDTLHITLVGGGEKYMIFKYGILIGVE